MHHQKAGYSRPVWVAPVCWGLSFQLQRLGPALWSSSRCSWVRQMGLDRTYSYPLPLKLALEDPLELSVVCRWAWESAMNARLAGRAVPIHDDVPMSF